MKKMNRKGFTLIELLAVLVILAVIMTIAIPSVTSSIERSRNKEKNMKIKLIESEAELYIDRNNVSTVTLTIPALINATGSTLRASDITDPNNSKRTLCGTVTCQNRTCTFTENTSNESTYCIRITS
mgnify:FL=1